MANDRHLVTAMLAPVLVVHLPARDVETYAFYNNLAAFWACVFEGVAWNFA